MLKIFELRVCQWICVFFCLSVYLSVSVAHALSLFVYVFVWRNEQQFKISPRERIKLHNENPHKMSCNICNGYYPSYVTCFPFVLLECHNLVAVFVVARTHAHRPFFLSCFVSRRWHVLHHQNKKIFQNCTLLIVDNAKWPLKICNMGSIFLWYFTIYQYSCCFYKYIWSFE